MLLAALTCAPALCVLVAVPPTETAGSATMVVGVLAGVLLFVGGLLFYWHWRIDRSPRQGWLVAATFVLAAQVLAHHEVNLVTPISQGHPVERYLILDAGTALLAMVMVVAGTRLRWVPDPLALGVTLGATSTVLRFAGLTTSASIAPGITASEILVLVVVACHLIVAVVALRDPDLPTFASDRVALMAVLIGVGQVVSAGFLGADAITAAAAAQVTAAGVWAGSMFVLLRETLEQQLERTASLEGSLLEAESSTRGVREQLHEVRNTVAGLASASRLLHTATVKDATRIRLEQAMETELARLERLMFDTSVHQITRSTELPAGWPGDSASRSDLAGSEVDVDHTIDQLLRARRDRGQAVTWRPSGACVRGGDGEPELSRVISMLLDDAETGPEGSSRIDVVSDDEEVRILVGPATAEHESNLAPARRLLARRGGSLTLGRGVAGPAYVVRLPAARGSAGNLSGDFGHA